MIKLSEIFLSIQGESTYQGLPCIFIRFAECNLRCSYCDSTYSYEPEYELGYRDVIERLIEFLPVKLVEITGGEPLLQEEIYPLIEELNRLDYNILLETNGSQSLESIPSYVTKIVDVKCPSSNESDSFLPDNLNFLSREDEVKFVLSNRKDYLFAKQFLAHNSLKPEKTHFSPVASSLSPAKLAEWILEDKLPVRLHLQLHKTVWPADQRGV